MILLADGPIPTDFTGWLIAALIFMGGGWTSSIVWFATVHLFHDEERFGKMLANQALLLSEQAAECRKERAEQYAEFSKTLMMKDELTDLKSAITHLTSTIESNVEESRIARGRSPIVVKNDIDSIH